VQPGLPETRKTGLLGQFWAKIRTWNPKSTHWVFQVSQKPSILHILPQISGKNSQIWLLPFSVTIKFLPVIPLPVTVKHFYRYYRYRDHPYPSPLYSGEINNTGNRYLECAKYSYSASLIKSDQIWISPPFAGCCALNGLFTLRGSFSRENSNLITLDQGCGIRVFCTRVVWSCRYQSSGGPVLLFTGPRLVRSFPKINTGRAGGPQGVILIWYSLMKKHNIIILLKNNYRWWIFFEKYHKKAFFLSILPSL